MPEGQQSLVFVWFMGWCSI